MLKTQLGIDALKKNVKKFIPSKKTKVAVLCHPASATQDFEHIVEVLESQCEIVALFGPQHGIYGETQDNMIEWEDQLDPKGRPIYSLYGKTRVPTDESLRDVELMIIDLFDVGARYYTFIYTMAYTLQVCGRLGIPVLICDRPNPLGGRAIEGPLLDLHFKSFVGLFPIPIRHGMTIAELALLFAETFEKKPKIQIAKLRGWTRSQLWDSTGLAWTLPSPNMPQFSTAVLYPGMCLLEATSLSEGRGTTRPFELIGAPFMDWGEIEAEYHNLCRSLRIPVAISFHRQGFIPTFHKFSGEICRGALQFCRNAKEFLPVRHSVILLWIFKKLYSSQWQWKDPPYEYEYVKFPIDILMGGTQTRETIDDLKPLGPLFRKWKEDEQKFARLRRPYLLYR